MKNLLLCCLVGVSLLSACPARGQFMRLAPRLSGQQFVEVTGGLEDRLTLKNSGWHVGISTGRYNRNLNAWKVSFMYLRKPLYHVPADSLALRAEPIRGLVEQVSLGYGRELVLYKSVFRTFLVRGQMVPFVGYEAVRTDHPLTGVESTYAPRSAVLAGADIGLDIEWQPVVLGIRQRWSPTSEVGRWGTLFYLGVRFGG